MNIRSIETYLRRPYRIYGRISTTISYGFASAVATREPFDVDKVLEAARLLGQDPDDLRCVYCGAPADNWDHLNGIVDDKEFSGYGHVIGNLVPSCGGCNGRKGNKPWRLFVQEYVSPDRREDVAARLAAHQEMWLGDAVDLDAIAPDDMARYRALRDQIFSLVREADEVASTVRAKTTARLWPHAPESRVLERAAQPPSQGYGGFHGAVFDAVSLSFRRPTVGDRSAQPFLSGRWGAFWVWVTEEEIRVVAYLATSYDVDKRRFNKALFDRLAGDVPAFAGALDPVCGDLVWSRLDDKQASWIGVVRPRPDFDDPAAVVAAVEWAATAVDRVVPFLQTAIRDAAETTLRELSVAD